MVWHRLVEDRDGSGAIDAFLRVGVAQSHLNPVGTYAGTGIVVTGLLDARPEDQFGLSVAHARTGRPLRRASTIGGAAVTRHETVFEATYRAQLTDWLTVQPDAQVIVHPGFDPSARHSLVIGARFEIAPPIFR